MYLFTNMDDLGPLTRTCCYLRLNLKMVKGWWNKYKSNKIIIKDAMTIDMKLMFRYNEF